MDESRRSLREQQSSSKNRSQAGGNRTAQHQTAATQVKQTTQTSGRFSHGTAADYQDPIQSIANVLNQHQHHLEQQKVFLSSAGVADDDDDDRESSAENSKLRSAKSVKQQQQQLVEQQASGRSLLLTVDNKSGSSQVAVNHQQQQQKNAGDTSRPHQKQQQQQQRLKELRAQADQQVVAVFKQQQQQRLSAGQTQLVPKLDQISSSPSTAAAKSSGGGGGRNHNKLAADSATIQSSQQVEQGNSYLYAYNDFITSSSASPVGQQQQQVVIKQTTKSNEQQVKTAAAAAVITNKQQQRDNSKFARQDSTAGLAPQVCLLTGETLSPQVAAAGASAIGGRRGLEVTTSSDHRRNQRTRRHLLEGQDSLTSESHEDDDDDDQEDGAEALSYILNRRQLLAAQQASGNGGVNQSVHQNCNLLHLRADSQQILADADVVAAAAACKQDNLNHLRQYLQIEENFNSYKAARRRRPAGASETATGGSFIIAANNRQVAASSHAAIDRQEHQANKQQQQQFLSFQPPPPPTATGGSDHRSGQGANYLSSSSLSSSQSSLNQQQTSQLFHGAQLEAAGVGRSYLQFFSRFAPANLLATSGGQKMYSANNQQVVGTLAGQPGAYYVTTNSEHGGASDSSQDNNATTRQQQLPPHLHHLHHAHLTGGHAHQLGPHHHAHHAHHTHHQHQHHLHGQLPHHHQHHQHHHHATITTSSDSSLGSSGPFATSSAVLGRTTGWLRDFCSKKCIFTSCVMLILFVFISVISLSAYLNFLINSNRTNLQPLSGRMRVNSELLMLGEQPPVFEFALNGNVTQQLQRLVTNKTSGEFLQKQRDFETILRGALDRTQPQLKTYPNHLVKLEVYAFRPTQASQIAQQPLWVYFRLFINKRTLQQDSQLMKRRAPDEQLESQFLPRLTQQTLLNGFEQLMSTFGGVGQPQQFGNRLVLASDNPAEPSDQAAPGQTLGVNSRRFGQQQGSESSAAVRRSSRAIAVAAGSARPATSAQQRPAASGQPPRSQQLKSFDEQISRLMHLIEAIDLQSIFVAPDFDLSASAAALGGSGASPASMSDTLRASPSLVPETTTTTQPTTTAFNFKPTISPPPSVTPIATPVNSSGNDDAQDNNKLLASGTTATSVKQISDDTNPAPGGTTRKFTLTQSYREDTTRPAGTSTTTTTTQRPSTTTTTKDSLFLLKHQQKPTRTPPTAIVRVQSGKPLENQAGQSANERQAAQARQAQEVAQKLRDGASLFNTNGRVSSSSTTTSPPPRSATPGGQQQVPRTPSSAVSTPVTVEELWQSAFNKSPSGEPLPVGQGRLITVTTIGGEGNGQQRQQQPSDWQKVSVLSAEVSNTIRAQMTNGGGGGGELTTTLTPVASSASSSVRPPKVSPHLNVGGNNGQPAKPARQNQQQHHHQPGHSAVVLNRDFATSTTTSTTPATVNSTANARAPQQQQQATTTTHKKKQKGGQQQSQRLSASNSLANDAAAAAAAGALRPTRNSTAANAPTSGQPAQQHKKPAKVKKVSAQTSAQNPSLSSDNLPSNRTTTESVAAAAASSELSSSNASELAANTQANAKPTTSVSKGIRIVDNFLASISSSAAGNSSRPVKLAHQQQPATADQLAPTTTTIELTRGTTALPPASRVGSTTAAPVGGESQRPPVGSQNNFVLASQQARPGTTSFSGQWRPLSSAVAAANQSNASDFWATTANQKPNNSNTSRASQPRKPNSNLSLIVASERIPAAGLGQASGSQSPFAMPNSALVMQQPQSNQRSRSPISLQSPRTTTPSNDFESHRVSRMRQSASHSHRSSDQVDPQFGSSSSSMSTTSGSSSSTTTVSSLATSSSGTTTSSSLMDADPPASVVPPNMRIVDDFMITTDRSQDSGRGTTLLPPLEAPIGVGRAPPISLVFAQGPKRTRGPFAFETLRSFESPSSTGSDAQPPPGDPTPPSEPFDVSGSISGFGEDSSPPVGIRSERSSSASLAQADKQQQQVLTDEKLLLRKHLFVDSSPSDGPNQDSSAGDLSFAPSTNSPIATAAPPTTPSDFANFGEQDDHDEDEKLAPPGRFGKRRLTTASSRNGRDLKPARPVCAPATSFGCVARDTGEFTCLSSGQVCDDSIDCQDESDELDCVALQRPEMQTNQMAPSNGAGIIYLNRRGSLAPMCVDNLPDDSSINATIKSESQAELIRQINTIGQYACRLQSFARLVSVKINHHDLVDNSNQIRDSKLFHRLAIRAASANNDDEGGDQNRISASSSFRSPSARFQVEISTSSECPSKRTVFVKCGSFECGQDSLQLATAGSRQQSASERAKALMRQQSGSASSSSSDDERNPLKVQDSPWLVKLYHKDALACHGYLIDESWLVAASECFKSGANETSTGGASRSVVGGSSWTAEISHDDDDDDGPTRRRRITDVLIQRTSHELTGERDEQFSPIVLAKIERPVRFSLLNRPICLPRMQNATSGARTTIANKASETNQTENYRNCFMTGLEVAPRAASRRLNLADDSLTPTLIGQDSRVELVLNKVQLLKRAEDCFEDAPPPNDGNLTGDLICARRTSAGEKDATVSPPGGDDEHSAARVLICSQQPTASTPSSRSRWVVVGVEHKTTRHSGRKHRAGSQLFASVSGQIDWIVDTMNPEPAKEAADAAATDNDTNQVNPNNSNNSARPSSSSRGRSSDGRGQLNANDNHQLNGLNPGAQHQPPFLFNNNQQQQQTCNRFKCSSGECLSWSRICDGLYDCSSHEDEMDCHK